MINQTETYYFFFYSVQKVFLHIFFYEIIPKSVARSETHEATNLNQIKLT